MPEPFLRSELGRGPEATLDMTRRIRALRATGADILTALWIRHLIATTGDGYVYDFATERDEALAGDPAQ